MIDHLFLAVACTLVHIPSIFIRYAPFREIITPAQRKILIPLYLLVLITASVIYFLLPDKDLIFFHKIMLVLVAFVLSGINVLIIPGHWREHWFTAGLASVHVSVTFFGAVWLVLHLTDIQDPDLLVASSAATTFLLFLLLLPIYCNSARRVVTPFLNMDSGDYWRRIWFIPLGLFFAAFFSAPMSTYSGSTTLLLCRMCLLVTTILMSNAISEDHNTMRHQLELAEQLNIQEEYYHGLTERVSEARKSRHDFKHHMAVIRKFIDTDDKSGLTDYWNELQIVLDQGASVPYTGNSALDGVLYRYAALSRKEGVRFEFSGIVEPLDMPATDLCVLLGNALDNAMTGCLRSPDYRYISVTARNNAGAQSLLITNSYDGIVEVRDDQILSRKRDHIPGIGLESMQSICNKHNAVMDIRYDDQTFNLLLVIPIKES